MGCSIQRPLKLLGGIARALVPVLAEMLSPVGASAQTSTVNVTPNLTPCGTYNAAALDPRPSRKWGEPWA